MCLLNQGLQYQGSIRWKFVSFKSAKRNGDYCTGFYSPSFREYYWRKNNTFTDYRKEYSNINSSQCGFHVYLFKPTAINGAKAWNRCEDKENDIAESINHNNYFILKLRCSNFIDGGIISACDDYSDGKRGERWEKAEVIGIFDFDGKDVTKQYEKYL